MQEGSGQTPDERVDAPALEVTPTAGSVPESQPGSVQVVVQGQRTRIVLAGEIDAAQARVIARSVAELPESVEADDRARAEQHMLLLAETFDAAQLRRAGRRLFEVIDPVAAEAAEARRLQAEADEADAGKGDKRRKKRIRRLRRRLRRRRRNNQTNAAPINPPNVTNILQLGDSLGDVNLETVLEILGLDPQRRAETVTVGEFVDLARALSR